MIRTMAAIHSLGGELDEVEIVEHLDNNHCTARYKDKYYTAIFNIFRGLYYVDDIYGEKPSCD